MDILNDINEALVDYHKAWKGLVSKRQNKSFFEGLQPTAMGWKTVDLMEFDQLFAELRELCDQVHVALINERWLATMHLKGDSLEWGIRVIKLMQRRPGSADAVGLDHIDFYSAEFARAEAVLGEESNLKWTRETNNPHCFWLSIWFNNTEAKLRSNSVLDVCIAELTEINKNVLDK